jgi:DNA-directed RNA polymerase subunit RPC12/RpoP
MENSLPKLKIDLREQPTVKCENCESIVFEEVTLIKKVSKLITGSSEDTIVPFPTYRCADCKHMNKDFNLFEKE